MANSCCSRSTFAPLFPTLRTGYLGGTGFGADGDTFAGGELVFLLVWDGDPLAWPGAPEPCESPGAHPHANVAERSKVRTILRKRHMSAQHLLLSEYIC
jgi:hypothetical protein